MSRKIRSAVSLILTFAMIFSMGIFASAENTKDYKLSETVSAVLNVNEKSLKITGTGKMPDYMSASDSPFGYSKKIKTVEISEGITHIGNNTFNSCSELTTVYLPTTLRSIGSSAFAYCKKLEDINFPANLEKLGPTVFYFGNAASDGRTHMPFIDKFPDGPVYLGNIFFMYKGSLPSPYTLKIKEGTTCIYERALQDNAQIKTLVLPSSLKTVEQFAFLNCSSLSSVKIPENTEYLGFRIFEDCTSLKKLRIPENTNVGFIFQNSGIRTIEGWQSSAAHQFVYDFNEGLGEDEQDKKITFINLSEHKHELIKVEAKEVTSTSEGSKEYYKCTDCGRIFDDAEGAYPASCADKIISVISEGRIGQDVRYKLYEDRTLVIYGKGETYNYYHDENGNKEMSDLSPFSDEADIKKIVVEEGITYLGNDLFSYAPHVEEVILPESLIEIGDRTFRNSRMKTIKFGNKLEIIGTDAFRNTSADFKFPESIKIIKDNALKDSTYLQNIKDNAKPGMYYIGTVLIRSHSYNGSVMGNVKAGTTCIYNEAFADCRPYYEDQVFFYEDSKTHELELAKDLIYIGGNAFSNMKEREREYYGKVLYKTKGFPKFNFEDYNVKPGTYSISPYAFDGAENIFRLIIPEGVVILGENACVNSTLGRVTIPSTVKTISAGAFSQCSELSLDIKEGVERIEEKAFYNTNISGDAIKATVFPDSIKEIGAMVFVGAVGTSRIPEFTLPKNLIRTGYKAFFNSPHSCYIKGDFPETLEYTGADLLSKIFIEPDENGLIYIGKVLYGCDPSKVSENITIKDGTTHIADKALKGAAKIKTITIPESVTSIGNYAFAGCTGLSSLELPSMLTHLGRNILDGNKNITEITFGKNIISINFNFSDFNYNGELFGPETGSGIKTIYATDEDSSVGGNYAYRSDTAHSIIKSGEHFLIPVKGSVTCSSPGIKDHYKCRICERVFAENNEETETDIESLSVPPLPHTPGKFVKENIVEPSGGKNGSYDQVVYCTVCHAEISRTKMIIPAADFLKGDIDGDKNVSAADARLALRYSVGLETGFTERQKIAADADSDKTVTAADARLILRVSVGLQDFS